MRYYCIPTKMAEIKKTDNTQCWQGCESTEMLIIAGESVNL